jgi:hypothetical protein
MRETIFKCDCCKQKSDIQPMSIAIGRYTDASGSRDTETVDFELCVHCMGLLVNSLLSDLKLEAPSAILRWLNGSDTDYRKG